PMPSSAAPTDEVPAPETTAVSVVPTEPALPPPPGISGVTTVHAGLPAAVTGTGVALAPAPPEPAAPAGPIRPGGQIQEPKMLVRLNPIYPELAKLTRVSGRVILEAIIDPQGRVQDVKVLSSVKLLDQAAIDAVRQWRYSPTLLNGHPVSVI